MFLLEGRDRLFRRAERLEDFNVARKPQVDCELSRMRKMSAREAAAVADQLVSEAEAAMAEAEEAVRDAEAAEARAEKAVAFSEAATKTMKGRTNSKAVNTYGPLF
ncbi:unnamed protein product [Linum trigynum]|uniref:Uncharacterized protein n=1 Tax=Linum trigynum TaxID=586398 RepID=A0AAV2DAN4_9ROSI